MTCDNFIWKGLSRKILPVQIKLSRIKVLYNIVVLFKDWEKNILLWFYSSHCQKVVCCLHFREYKDKIRQKKIRTYDEIGGLFYQKKKLHNTENSTLNHKNVDSVDPEESCIHTYTFKFKIGIFFCQKPIMFFCSLS